MKNSKIRMVPTILARFILGYCFRPIMSQIRIEKRIIINGIEQWESRYTSNLEIALKPDYYKKQSRDIIYDEESLAWRLKSKKFWS